MRAGLKLRGIITALVTPFSADNDVDEAALEELVQFQVESGVHGLFALGTTGMGPVMEPLERERVAEIVVRSADGRIPVIVQVGDVNPAVTLDLARHAEKVGADAVASLTPFYYQPGADAIIEHYRRLTQATDLPVLIYNIPRNTGNNVDAKLLYHLSRMSHMVGIKDSSRDFPQLLDYLSAVPEGFAVINGADSYHFSAFCAGVKAGVSAAANVVPEMFVRMYEAHQSGDLEQGEKLQKSIHSLRQVMSNPALAPILEALKIRGLKSGFVRPPLRKMTVEETAALRAAFSRLTPDLSIAH